MKHRNDAGFSLVEVMVAIVILGIIVVPLTSGLVVAVKTLDKADEMMRAQLAVSSAVETLMAEGINNEFAREPIDGDSQMHGVVIYAKKENGNNPYYNVTATYYKNGKQIIQPVETFIREVEGGATG